MTRLQLVVRSTLFLGIHSLRLGILSGRWHLTFPNLLICISGGPAVFVGGWAIAKGVLMFLDEGSANKVGKITQ